MTSPPEPHQDRHNTKDNPPSPQNTILVVSLSLLSICYINGLRSSFLTKMLRPRHFPIPARPRMGFPLGARQSLFTCQGRRGFSTTFVLSRTPDDFKEFNSRGRRTANTPEEFGGHVMSAREHRSLRRKMEKEETMHLKRLARALEGNHEGDFVDRGVPQYKAIPPQYKEITPYSRWTHWPLPETSPQPKSIPWVRLPHDYAKVYRGDKLRNWVMHISAKMGPGKVLHKSLSAWCFNVWKRSRTTDVHIARITKLDEKIEMYTRELRDGEAKLRRDIATLLLQAALHEMTNKLILLNYFPGCPEW